MALLFPATATAYTFELDGIYYYIDGNEAIVTCNYETEVEEGYFNSYSGEVTIPPSVTYDGMIYPVTTIDGCAFYGCSGLTSVTIPNSVTEISDFGFYNCSGLTSVTIPNSVTSINNCTFKGCSGLTSVTIPNSVTIIRYEAFEGCTSLTSIDIPNSVTYIDEFAFFECRKLTYVNLGNSVKWIGDDAFWDCGLTDITIPDSVTHIGQAAFGGCAGLKSATIGRSVTSLNGVFIFCASLETLNYNAVSCDDFDPDLWKKIETDRIMTINIGNEVQRIPANFASDLKRLSSIDIPNSVTEIGEKAFCGCTGLTSVTIGSRVETIGTEAFNYCDALDTVKCLGTAPVMASSDCFSTAAYNRSQLLVPRQHFENYQATDYWYMFGHIDGWGSAGLGDADGDGLVTIGDVTAIIDVLLSGNTENIYFDSADMNRNGRLEIGDVTTLIDMLLNGPW